jgi:hypothetical protein
MLYILINVESNNKRKIVCVNAYTSSCYNGYIGDIIRFQTQRHTLKLEFPSSGNLLNPIVIGYEVICHSAYTRQRCVKLMENQGSVLLDACALELTSASNTEVSLDIQNLAISAMFSPQYY